MATRAFTSIGRRTHQPSSDDLRGVERATDRKSTRGILEVMRLIVPVSRRALIDAIDKSNWCLMLSLLLHRTHAVAFGPVRLYARD